MKFVDNKFHAHLLVCTRLGTLPIEIETRRWNDIPRMGRLCGLGCGVIGDTSHFLRGCKAITADRVMSPDYFESRTQAVKSPFFLWRGIARTLESRWRERSKKLRAVASVPHHPADEQDEAATKEVDTLALRDITASV